MPRAAAKADFVPKCLIASEVFIMGLIIGMPIFKKQGIPINIFDRLA